MHTRLHSLYARLCTSGCSVAASYKSMFNFGVRASSNVLVKVTCVLHQRKRPRHVAFLFLPHAAIYFIDARETGSPAVARQRLIIARLDAARGLI